MLEKILDKWQHLSKAGKIVVVIAILGALNLVFAPEPKKQEPVQQNQEEKTETWRVVDNGIKDTVANRVREMFPNAENLQVTYEQSISAYDIQFDIKQDFDSIEAGKATGLKTAKTIVNADIAPLSKVTVVMTGKTINNSASCMAGYISALSSQNNQAHYFTIVNGQIEEYK